MKINFLIYSGQLTEEQIAMTAEIEENLQTIMKNYPAVRFDVWDVRDHKKKLKILNRKFPEVFQRTPGLYVYQSNYYSIQWCLEEHLKEPVLGVFAYKYSDELFRYAFIHELAIYTHNKGGALLYPIQVRAITVWLLLCYFDIQDFKAKEFDQAFAVAEACMEEDYAMIKKIWVDIDRFKELNLSDIQDLNESKNKARRIVRWAKRCLSRNLKTSELKLHHFVGSNHHVTDYYNDSYNSGFDYKRMLKVTAETYHLSERTIKKRAKEIGLTEEVYDKELINYSEHQSRVNEELEVARDILENGPFTKQETWTHYKKRFKVGRTFCSGITSDIIDEQTNQNASETITYQPFQYPFYSNNLNDPEYVRQLFSCVPDPYDLTDQTVSQPAAPACEDSRSSATNTAMTAKELKQEEPKPEAKYTSAREEFMAIDDECEYIMRALGLTPDSYTIAEQKVCKPTPAPATTSEEPKQKEPKPEAKKVYTDEELMAIINEIM